MKYISFIVIIVAFLSCKTEEDKYPDMAVFEPTMEGDFVFEEIEATQVYYRDTDKYVFFKEDYPSYSNSIFIYDKKTKKLLKTLEHIPNVVDVYTDGSIYGLNQETKKVFKYQAPDFKKTLLESISLEYVSDKSLEQKYALEIKDNNLTEKGRAYYDFLQQKRYDILKRDVINKLICITKLYNNDAILHYSNKEVYVTSSNYLYQGTIIKSKLKGVENCKSSGYKLDEVDYFKKAPLKLIDYVTLDYNFTGSNHIVIGVSSKNLYYYELSLNGKSTKFKFPYTIRNVVNLEDEVILETGYKYYKVSTKK